MQPPLQLKSKVPAINLVIERGSTSASLFQGCPQLPATLEMQCRLLTGPPKLPSVAKTAFEEASLGPLGSFVGCGTVPCFEAPVQPVCVPVLSFHMNTMGCQRHTDVRNIGGLVDIMLQSC